MKTAIEYELAKRMRSATRWVEGQQGMLPPEDSQLPPGYGASAAGTPLKLVLTGDLPPNSTSYRSGKIINSTNLDLGGLLNLPAPDTYGQDVWVTSLDGQPPLPGSRNLAWLSGSLSITGGNRPLYVVQEKAAGETTATIVPLGMRTIYLIDPATGKLRTDLPFDFVIWIDPNTSSPSFSSSLYLPSNLFLQGDAEGQSRPTFVYSYDATKFDNTRSGTKASWAGSLAGKIWSNIASGLVIRNPRLIALPTNYLYTRPNYQNDSFSLIHRKAKWVFPEIIDGETYLRDVNIIGFADTQIAIRDMGFIYKYAYACTYDGAKITGGSIPSPFCMSEDFGVKIIYETNGLVNTVDTVLIAAVNGFFKVIQVKHNKAPNYVASSSTLGAPLGAPLGG